MTNETSGQPGLWPYLKPVTAPLAGPSHLTQTRYSTPVSYLLPFRASTRFPFPGSHLFSFVSLTLIHLLSPFVLIFQGAAQTSPIQFLCPSPFWQINSEQYGSPPLYNALYSVL